MCEFIGEILAKRKNAWRWLLLGMLKLTHRCQHGLSAYLNHLHAREQRQ